MNYILWVIQNKKMAEYMPNKPAFSFIEVIVGLLLIAALGSFVLPNIFRKNEDAQTRAFISDFESLMHVAVIAAMQEEKVVQVYFDVLNKSIFLQIQDPESIHQGIHLRFTPLQKKSTKITIPDWLTLQEFYVGDIDEGARGPLKLVWMYVMPNATAQPVIINFANEHPELARDKKLSFVINPFLGQVSTFYEFQKP
jgi:type II secretory pathway pseudopilin PulG